MATNKTGPGGTLYSLDYSTNHVSLPFKEEDHLEFLQKMCGGNIEMFFSPDGKHCFYGNEDGRYTQKPNTNPDLIKLLGYDCDLYGPIFRFDTKPEF